MCFKTCWRFISRRCRRSSLANIIFIILCFSLFLQFKYNIIYSSSSVDILFNNASCTDILSNKTVLSCSGDPVKQWCEKEVNLCHSSLIVYDKLFFVTRLVILQPKFAKGKRLGGEDIQSVLNQAEYDEYFEFTQGFIKLPCNNSIPDDIISKSHLSSILSSITPYETCSNVDVIINETTIAINRYDYANMYHTITDLYTVYLLCRFFGRDPKSVRILFLDAHPKGNLDVFWSHLFHSYTRLGHLKNYSTIVYHELIWSQPQSKSAIDVVQQRTTAPSFFSDFREHILQQFNITYQTNKQLNCQSVQILFLGRRNYVAHPRNPSGKVARQLLNENKILNELKTKFSLYPGINFTFNYFEQLTIEEQLKHMIQTDVFIGMHGAGLTHVVFLHSKRALVELATSSTETQRHFEQMASMNSVMYRRCSITNGSPPTAQIIFHCTKEIISQMCPNAMNNNQIVRTIATVLENVSPSTSRIE